MKSGFIAQFQNKCGSHKWNICLSTQTILVHILPLSPLSPQPLTSTTRAFSWQEGAWSLGQGLLFLVTLASGAPAPPPSSAGLCPVLPVTHSGQVPPPVHPTWKTEPTSASPAFPSVQVPDAKRQTERPRPLVGSGFPLAGLFSVACNASRSFSLPSNFPSFTFSSCFWMREHFFLQPLPCKGSVSLCCLFWAL